MIYEKQLLDYVKNFDGEKFDSQEIKEAYDFFKLILNQIEIDASLNYDNILERKVYACLQVAFESFFVYTLMNKKMARNDAKFIISQINKML
jgi:hypothetical protein